MATVLEGNNWVEVMKNSPKSVGIVCRGGKKHTRQYGRELKNGKGLSSWDRLVFDLNQVYRETPIKFPNIFNNG